MSEPMDCDIMRNNELTRLRELCGKAAKVMRSQSQLANMCRSKNCEHCMMVRALRKAAAGKR